MQHTKVSTLVRDRTFQSQHPSIFPTDNLVVQHRVPVREGAALNVLSR